MSPELRRFLAGAGVPFTVHAHASVVSFEEARAALPFDPAAMVKGLAFRIPGGPCAIVALRAADRADYKRIADALHIRRADLRLASGEEIAAELDMQPGGVAPLPIRGARVLIDRAVAQLAVVICGTGRSDSSLEIACADLIRIAGGTLGDFARR